MTVKSRLELIGRRGSQMQVSVSLRTAHHGLNRPGLVYRREQYSRVLSGACVCV